MSNRASAYFTNHPATRPPACGAQEPAARPAPSHLEVQLIAPRCAPPCPGHKGPLAWTAAAPAPAGPPPRPAYNTTRQDSRALGCADRGPSWALLENLEGDNREDTWREDRKQIAIDPQFPLHVDILFPGTRTYSSEKLLHRCSSICTMTLSHTTITLPHSSNHFPRAKGSP